MQIRGTPKGEKPRRPVAWIHLAVATGSLVAFLAVAARAAPGDLEPSFGVAGRVVTNLTPGNDAARDLALQEDGKIVVVGRASSAVGYGRFSVLRYERSGTLDPAFGRGGIVIEDFGPGEDSAEAVAIQRNGKIVVVGGSDRGRHGAFALMRFRRNGRLDRTFGRAGRVTTDFTNAQDIASDVAIGPNGRITVVGTVTGSGDVALARYDLGGALDPSFGQDGKVIDDRPGFGTATALALQADGRIVVAGSTMFEDCLDAPLAVLRFGADGEADRGFGIDGLAAIDLTEGCDYADAVALQPDGRIVVAGDAGLCCEYTSSFGIARLTSEGSPDASFGTGGKVVTNFTRGDDLALDVVIQPDGRIVAAGVAGGGWDTRATFALARYEAGGTLDATFGGDGRLRTSFAGPSAAAALALQPNGGVVVAGTVYRGADGALALARYSAR